MSRQILNISPEATEFIRSKTFFSIPSRSLEIVTGIQEYFKNKKVALSKESLLNDDYANFSLEEKNKLLVNFYWMHNQNMKTNEAEFVSLKMMHEHLKIQSSYENRYLREYSFTYSTPCPCCGSTVNANFKNLKIIQISETECPICSHVLGDAIYSKCQCEYCTQIIDEVESYVNGLSKMIENSVQDYFLKLNKSEARELSEQKLKWFADKYSSDLSKDERESISYEPNSVKELQEMLGKRAPRVFIKLKEKNAIYEKLILKNKEKIIFEIKKDLNAILYHRSLHSSGGGRIDFNTINLSSAKVKYLKTFIQRWGSSEQTAVEIVFDNNSFEFILDRADSKGREWYKDLENLQIELFSLILPCGFYLGEDMLFEKVEVLNPFFFKPEIIVDYPTFNKNMILPLFKSKVECNKYHFLINKYRNCIIMANVRLADLVVIKSIESFYNAEELRYLRNCILDFVFYSDEGLPIKVLELQRGEHHNDIEYITKDKLKKSAVKRIGILYEETF